MSGLRGKDNNIITTESIRITCLGDLLPANTAYTAGKGIWNNISGLIDYYANLENNPFRNTDILICNLEAPLIQNSRGMVIPFAGNPEVIQFMNTLGIDIVSLANNHMLDHGKEGLDQTRDILADNGFHSIGLRDGQISGFTFLERKKKKFAFAAFNAIHDHPQDTATAPLEREILFNTLEEIKKQKADYILFSFHWGNEYVRYPSPHQVDLAHELIDQGVNVIIGHHPHVIQPVEKYNGGIIIYSLGNFLFDMFWAKSVRSGMYVDLVFSGNKEINFEIIPFYIRSDFTQDYSKSDRILSILEKSSKTLQLLQAGPGNEYQRIYARECRIRRLEARLKMKLFLIKNLLQLSPDSRKLLFRNLKKKLNNHWKKK